MRKPPPFTLAAGTIGAGLIFGAIARDGAIDTRDVRILGAVLLLSALGSLALRRICQPVSAAYELGHTEGYREGYEDGRTVGRPVVVKLPSTCRTDAGRHGCGAVSNRQRPVAASGGDGRPVESAEWGHTGADSPN